MNVYSCWYRGLSGYCCRGHNSRWMFVPELGQTNNNIQKHISFHELVFDNSFARQYELELERRLQKLKINPFNFLKYLLFPARKASTVGGMLFSTI